MPKFFAPASLVALAALMAFSVFSCCLLGLYLIAGVGIRLPFKELIAVLIAAIVLMLAARAAPRFGNYLRTMPQENRLWGYAVLLGLGLRLGVWMCTLPVVQINDGLHYLELAQRLYQGQPYAMDGHAFWPPGTPFIYTAFLYVLGPVPWIAVAVNCVFFLLAAVAVRRICSLLDFGPRAAGLTVATLALWPALFLTASQVSKETLLIGLLPAVFALVLSRRPGSALAAGAVAGLAILTQPSLMLLPALIGVALLAARLPLKTIFLRLLLLAIGAAAVIAPWSYRNYQVFGEAVAVSTNAGLVLHAGNQPAMVKPLGEVGGFLEPPAPPVPMANDLLLSRWHQAEAFRFILANKLDFARLVWNRVVITMGDDSDSAYRSLRLTNKVSDKAYLVAKALSNAYWMFVAAMLTGCCWSARKSSAAPALAPAALMAAGATVCLMAVHGMAEGGARHHMAWSWLYALVLVVAAVRVRRAGDLPVGEAGLASGDAPGRVVRIA
jgi:hypothetical protein